MAGTTIDSLLPSSRLNAALCIVVPVAMLALLAIASQLSWPWSLLIGAGFSFLMLTNYALMHESSHGYLHTRPFMNAALGTFVGWHFPMSCRFLYLTHLAHHRCNRTDHEMFDYYYADDNMFIKYCQWYGILSGLHYLIVPLGSVLVSLVPGMFRLKIFTRSRSSGVLFDDFKGREIWYIRAEVVLGIVYWVAMFNLLQLQWHAVLILYAMAGFHWSTRQYLTHAFTPRDVRNGAIILKANPLMRGILLNGNFDLVHHQRPEVPWVHLPAFAPDDVPAKRFWHQYAAMWRGPRPNTEVAPIPESN